MSDEPRNADASEIIDARIVMALSHPIRVQILAALSHRSVSPAEFSREHGKPLSDIAYHFRKLEELKCAEVVRTAPVRGSTQHFYRGTKRPLLGDGVWKQLPQSILGGLSASVLKDFTARAVEALEAGTFDSRDDSHFTWTPFLVDEEGWSELTGILATALEQATEVEVRSAARIAKSGEEGINTIFALAGFESPREPRAK